MGLWQRNYYEHIIRTQKSLNMLRIYIELNPVLWEKGADLGDINLSEEDMDKILLKYYPENRDTT